MTDLSAGAGPSLTWLYVPGDRPDRFAKAIDSGGDEVILDLEDSVAPAHKDAARAAVREFLARPQPRPVQVDAPPVRDRLDDDQRRQQGDRQQLDDPAHPRQV